MKSILALVFSMLFLSSYTQKENKPLKAKEIEKGFVQISDRLSMGKYEVSNEEYRRFMAFLKSTNDLDLYKACLLDTTQSFRESDDETLKKHYYSHPAYAAYPVVAVSYDGANEYCRWLTSQYNGDESRKFKKVIFRLPTEAEWTAAASGNNPNKMYP